MVSRGQAEPGSQNHEQQQSGGKFLPVGIGIGFIFKKINYSNEMVIPNTTEVLSLTWLGSWPLYWRHASMPYVTVGA